MFSLCVVAEAPEIVTPEIEKGDGDKNAHTSVSKTKIPDSDANVGQLAGIVVGVILIIILIVCVVSNWLYSWAGSLQWLVSSSTHQ